MALTINVDKQSGTTKTDQFKPHILKTLDYTDMCITASTKHRYET